MLEGTLWFHVARVYLYMTGSHTGEGLCVVEVGLCMTDWYLAEKRFGYRTAGSHVRSHIEEKLEYYTVGSHVQLHIEETLE